MNFVEAERTTGKQFVEDCAATYQKVWDAACQHDKIDPKAPIVVFSETNPMVPFLTRIADQFREALQGYASHGYVGMTMGGPKKVELYQRKKRQRRGAG